MLLTYNDAYLAKFCTEEREARAFDDVDALGTFTQAWREKLATVRCYVIACLENQGQPDDLFASKLKHYRDEYSVLAAQAKSASQDDEGNPVAVFSIPLERA
jgi:hypothetical protein